MSLSTWLSMEWVEENNYSYSFIFHLFIDLRILHLIHTGNSGRLASTYDISFENRFSLLILITIHIPIVP